MDQVEALKLPPYSVEAEQSVLGALLIDNSAWDKIADVIGEVDFYRADHRLIFQHISRLIEDNKPADMLTVAESLQRSGKLEEIGGQAYIGTLAINTPNVGHVLSPGQCLNGETYSCACAGAGETALEAKAAAHEAATIA